MKKVKCSTCKKVIKSPLLTKLQVGKETLTICEKCEAEFIWIGLDVKGFIK